MSNYYPELSQRILEMAEGDEDFRIELTAAIYSGLSELKSVYTLGFAEKDEVKIQQIRHKIKPTLAMFDFDQLAETVQHGKEILESQGFGSAFEAHFQAFLKLTDEALNEVGRLAK